MSISRIYTGGCQCGAVRYRAEGTLADPHLCHCRMCQKAAGNYFMPLANAARTGFSLTRDKEAGATMATWDDVRRMNPMYFIGQQGVTIAPHWRIRHGAKDRDTSLAVPALLALKLQDSGYDVDFASPWARGHAGDYAAL